MVGSCKGPMLRVRVVVACLWAAASARAGVQALELSCATIAGRIVKLESREHPAQPLVLASADRAVFIDGTARGSWLHGPSVAANAADPAALGLPSIADVRLDTLEFTPVVVDLALPCHGPSWPLARSSRRLSSDPGAVLGPGWHHDAQVQASFEDVPGSDLDVVRLVLGGDRFTEFRRVLDDRGKPTDVFRGVNGAAGAVVRSFTPVLLPGDRAASKVSIFTFHDPLGVEAVFFGPEADLRGHRGAWQLWKITDAAGAAACAGGRGAATDPALAITQGYDALGRVTLATDSAGRSYVYTHGMVDGVHPRLFEIRVDAPDGRRLASVRYDYGTAAGAGRSVNAGDLCRVAVSTPVEGGDLTRTTLYRTWTPAASSTTGDFKAGPLHAIRMVVEPEGVRRAGTLVEADDAALAPYASVRLGYRGDAVARIEAEGLTGRRIELSIERPATPPPPIDCYDARWASRTIVRVIGDGLGPHVPLRTTTHYFDKAGQSLSTTVAAPAGSNTTSGLWVWPVTRDDRGCVTVEGMPSSVASFDVATGAWTWGSGAVRLYDRLDERESTRWAGFVRRVARRVGTSGPAEPVLELEYLSDRSTTLPRRVFAGGLSIARPLVSSMRTYPRGVAVDPRGLATEYQYHLVADASPSRASGLVVSWIDIAHPAISTLEHGSGLPTRSAVAMSRNGRITHIRARGDDQGRLTVLEYDTPERGFGGGMATGRIVRVHDDAAGLEPDVPPMPEGFPPGRSQAHVRTRTYAHDALGQLASMTDPEGRTAVLIRTRLADGQEATVAATMLPDGAWVSPGELSVMTLDGESTFDASIAFGAREPGWNQVATTHVDPRRWIDPASSEPARCLSAALEDGSIRKARAVEFDASGRRVVATRTYHRMPDAALGDDPEGKEDLHFDVTRLEHDAFGRVVSIMDPTRTVDRVEWDAFDRPRRAGRGVEGGSSPLVAEWIYDDGRAGGDGLLTEVRRFVAPLQPPRVTRLRYDAQGRMTALANPVPPHVAVAWDASGRPAVAAAYGGTQASFLSLIDGGASPGSPHASLKATRIDHFDAMGQRFRRETIAGSGLPEGVPPTRTLTTQWWYDPQGRVAMRHGERTRKFAYDDLCGCGASASWTCVVPRLGLGTYPYEQALSLQPDDVVLAMSLAARDPVTGLVRASASLRRAPGAFEAGCDAGHRYDLFGLPDDGTVAINLEAACGMLADVRVNTHDALGRTTASLRLGDPRLAGASPTSLMVATPGTALTPSQSGGVMRSPIAPYAARGDFTSINNLGEAFATENHRGDRTQTTLDDAGRVTSERTSLGGMTPTPAAGPCVVPTSTTPTTPSRTDGLGDQTDYQYDRGRPTVICAGSVCSTPRSGEDAMLDAGESLRIEYPDTTTQSPGVICAGTFCDGDPMNDNRLPKRLIVPGSLMPGEHAPRHGDAIDLRHNLQGEVTARRDGAGVTSIIERDEAGRERRVRLSNDERPDATGLPPAEGGIASIETFLDDMGLMTARQHVASDGRVTSRVAWERDAWGQVTATSLVPSMAGGAAPTRAALPAALAATLGMEFHRTWVGGMAMGEGSAWRGSRLEGVTMPGSPRGPADLTFGRDMRREPGLARGLGEYTGAVGMIAFPDDGRGVADGGVPRALAEYVNQGIAWPEEVDLPQAGYAREQFRGMGMAVIPAPEPEHATGLNQFGEPTVDRWRELCAAANCGPASEDATAAPFDQRVADPPPAETCACSIFTEDLYEPQESKQEEIVCAGLLETTRGWDAGGARAAHAIPPRLHRITQYSIQGTNIASRRELRSDDDGQNFREVEATRATFTTANQVAASLTTIDGPGGERTAAGSPRYDARGHLRDEGCVTKADGTPGRVFQYDHAGRLVAAFTRAADGRADVPLARFTHDALGRLASATYNRRFIDGSDPDDSTLDDDVTDLYVQDPSWRIVAVVRRDPGPADDPTVRAWVRERWVHHHAGDGEGVGAATATGDDAPAARFIDDDGDGVFETVQHFLCNRRGDVVAIVQPGLDAEPNDGSDRATTPGRVIARVWYDDYGLPRAYGPLDLNQDGVSDLTDLATFVERLHRCREWASDPRTQRESQRLRNQLDWNRDGTVTTADGDAFTADLADHLGESFDARETLGNLPLYAGAWWDAWLRVYHVRHRVLDPKEARWLQRDPIGYAGGSNLYAYVGNQPGRHVDPLGLRWAEAGGGGAGQPAGDGGEREECRRNERWVERPSSLGAWFRGFAANLGNWGDPAAINQGPGPRPAAPRGNGPNQGVDPLDELMHAVDVADRTGNVSIAALSTNRFTASQFDEFTQNVATGMQVAEIAASMAFEPVDLAIAFAAVAETPGDWTAWASMLPFVPSAVRILPSSATGRSVGQVLGREYDSWTLRTNLVRMGANIPERAVAHHVVGNSVLAQQVLHPILKKLGLDLNDAANGIMLNEEFHRTLGTSTYRKDIVDRLQNVTEADELHRVLDQIKRELLEQQDGFLRKRAEEVADKCQTSG